MEKLYKKTKQQVQTQSKTVMELWEKERKKIEIEMRAAWQNSKVKTI